MGLYVYAIGRSDQGVLPPVLGVLDQPAFRLEAGPLCAIVSQCPDDTVRAERRHIAATQRVFATLNSGFDFLPMAFGTVTRSAAELRQFLDGNQDSLAAQLDRVAGAVEMSVRLRFDLADPIGYLVARTPALRAARDRAFGGGRKPSHDGRLKLGRMVDDALTRFREAGTERMTAALRPACAEILALPLRDEKEIANLAALVARDRADRFEAAVEEAAAGLDDEIVVSIGGPWPPHNFVRLDPGRD